jgi:hypothetical protein
MNAKRVAPTPGSQTGVSFLAEQMCDRVKKKEF